MCLFFVFRYYYSQIFACFFLGINWIKCVYISLCRTHIHTHAHVKPRMKDMNIQIITIIKRRQSSSSSRNTRKLWHINLFEIHVCACVCVRERARTCVCERVCLYIYEFFLACFFIFSKIRFANCGFQFHSSLFFFCFVFIFCRFENWWAIH